MIRRHYESSREKYITLEIGITWRAFFDVPPSRFKLRSTANSGKLECRVFHDLRIEWHKDDTRNDQNNKMSDQREQDQATEEEDEDEAWDPIDVDEESDDSLVDEIDINDDFISVDNLSSDSEFSNAAPCWTRLPSQDTEHSDWQLDVQFYGSSDTMSYAVHRFELGMQSTYFSSIFRHNEAFVESTTQRSFIIFPGDLPVDVQQKHFELFLNFLYRRHTCDCDEDACDADEDDISVFLFYYHVWGRSDLLPLLYLSDHFGVKALRKRIAQDFIIRKLHYNDCPLDWIIQVYHLADRLSMTRLKSRIERWCLKKKVATPFVARDYTNIKSRELKRNFSLELERSLHDFLDFLESLLQFLGSLFAFIRRTALVLSIIIVVALYYRQDHLPLAIDCYLLPKTTSLSGVCTKDRLFWY